jgi:beta-1,2-mannobiose phosphorylase / 1,2-beta-oligomannan phosphorylase
MIKVSKGKIILKSRLGIKFENEGVLNPACVDVNGVTHMFYRAARRGKFSTIGYCQIKNDRVIFQTDKPILVPEYRYEKGGLEDPRVTFLDGRYYMFYTAYDGNNATIAYAVSNDLKKWIKKGLISPQITYDEAEDIFKLSKVGEKYTYYEKVFKRNRGNKMILWEKDAMLFPKKINGKYALIHRILPGIQICYFKDFDELTINFWKKYLRSLKKFLILDPKHPHETSYIGGGCVPIETKYGWLVIYHSVETDIDKGQVYHASAALLDINKPTKVINSLNYPLFSPTEEWEKKGVMSNVVFPSATSLKGDILSIFYGAADDVIGVRKLSLSSLLKELLNENKKTN